MPTDTNDCVSTDAPTDNQGKGEAFSSTDLTATSLATCILTTMGIRAKELDITGTRAEVTKIMAPTRAASAVLK